jgi:hypothetical protein
MEARKLYNNAVGQATPRGSASWETLSSFEPRTVLRHPVEPVVCACEPNHYNVTVLLEGTMTARCRCFLGVLFLFLCASALPQTFGQVHTDVPSKSSRTSATNFVGVFNDLQHRVISLQSFSTQPRSVTTHRAHSSHCHRRSIIEYLDETESLVKPYRGVLQGDAQRDAFMNVICPMQNPLQKKRTDSPTANFSKKQEE